MRAVLSIGSNLGDRAANLRGVVAGLGESVVAVSPLYATPPWGGVEQPDFYNAILIVETSRTPVQLLRAGLALEDAAYRRRATRWGPRTLDVDLVTCVVDGVEVCSDTEELRLPHPHAASRAFVLVPWLAVEPEAVLGGYRVAELVAGLDTSGIVMVAKEWV